jgi:hypothetical protein
MEPIRSDFVFSYWIFAWFILYLFRIVPYSPKFIIILGIIENVFALLYMIFHKTPLYNIIKFIIINIFIKVIPLLLVWSDKIVKRDIYATIIIFLVYLLWLTYNHIEIYKIYKKVLDPYIFNNQDGKTILSKLYDSIVK